MTATNAVGSVTANAIVNVTVIPGPMITSFTATPPVSPSPGSPVVLTCQATNVASITMAGILFLPGTATYKVYPTVDTTYTCIATGTNGQTVSQTVMVKVTQPRRWRRHSSHHRDRGRKHADHYLARFPA